MDLIKIGGSSAAPGLARTAGMSVIKYDDGSKEVCVTTETRSVLKDQFGRFGVRSLTEVAHLYDKDGRLLSARVTAETPGGLAVTGVRSTRLSHDTASRFAALTGKCHKKRDLSSLGQFIYRAAPAQDRQTIRAGLAILSTTEDGRRRAQEWKELWGAQQ